MTQFDMKVIPFEAVYNFRDMGGYKSRDGRIVKRLNLSFGSTRENDDGG